MNRQAQMNVDRDYLIDTYIKLLSREERYEALLQLIEEQDEEVQDELLHVLIWDRSDECYSADWLRKVINSIHEEQVEAFKRSFGQ